MAAFESSEIAGNVPHPHSAAVPRPAEMNMVIEPLRSEYRLLTITGLPGVGKSRLAIEVAHAIEEEFYDRAWFVPLNRLQQNRGVADLVAQKLGVQRRRREGPIEALTRFLRGKQLLLVLDNCEPLVVEVAETVKEILAGSEYVRVIATSRQPLGIVDEKLLRLGGLGFPNSTIPLDLSAIAAFPAVELFLKRVSAKLAKLERNILTARKMALITSLVEGNPLQIEIIA